MSTADRRRANAARFSSAPTPAAEVEDLPADAVAAPAELGRKIRGTYNLYPAHFRGFERWCADAAEALGEPTLTKQDAIDYAVRLVLSDETTSRRLIAALRQAAAEGQRGQR